MVYAFHEWLTKPQLYKLVFPKPILSEAACILCIRKCKVVFFFPSSAFLCCYVRLALTPSCGFFLLYLVDIVLEIYPWSLHLRRDLFKYLERRENYLLVFLVLCRYTNLVDHHLPALCPLWVGDNWLVIIRHYYGYYFHFKKTQRQIVQDHRRKGIFKTDAYLLLVRKVQSLEMEEPLKSELFLLRWKNILGNENCSQTIREAELQRDFCFCFLFFSRSGIVVRVWWSHTQTLRVLKPGDLMISKVLCIYLRAHR